MQRPGRWVVPTAASSIDLFGERLSLSAGVRRYNLIARATSSAVRCRRSAAFRACRAHSSLYDGEQWRPRHKPLVLPDECEEPYLTQEVPSLV